MVSFGVATAVDCASVSVDPVVAAAGSPPDVSVGGLEESAVVPVEAETPSFFIICFVCCGRERGWYSF